MVRSIPVNPADRAPMKNRIRRRLVLAVPFVAAVPLVSGLTGCLGPTKEEQAYADDLETRAAQVSGVAEVSVGIDRDLGRAARLSVSAVGEADRPVLEVAETARALTSLLAAETPPDSLHLGDSPGVLRQSDQGRGLRIVLTLDPAESASRVSDSYQELNRGAVEVDGSELITSIWTEPGPQLLQPIGSRSVVRKTSDPQLSVSLRPGESATALPITEVAAALAPVARWIQLDFRQGHPSWVCQALDREVDDAELVAAVEAALQALTGARTQEFEVKDPWWVVLSVGMRVELARWSSSSRREVAEPVVTDLLQRLNG